MRARLTTSIRVVAGLLAVIAALLAWIGLQLHQFRPVTQAELQSLAERKDEAAHLSARGRIPLVRVANTVDVEVQNTVEVEVQGTVSVERD